MSPPETYLGFGSLVAAFGIGLITFHVRAHQQYRRRTDLTDVDRRFFERQYVRRLQTSALTVCLGGLIGLCGYIKAFEDSPTFATVYVVGLLLLTFWLVLLAATDAMASRVHLKRSKRSTDTSAKTLQQALAEVREAHGLDP